MCVCNCEYTVCVMCKCKCVCVNVCLYVWKCNNKIFICIYIYFFLGRKCTERHVSAHGCSMLLHESLCVCCSVLWKHKKSPSHLLVSRVRRRSRPGGATWPFFTWLQHITSFPLVQTPPLPTGLTALTSRPNPQNSLSSTPIPPSSSLSASFSSLSPSGASSWWMAPQERVAGRVRSAFWNFSEVQRTDG